MSLSPEQLKAAEKRWLDLVFEKLDAMHDEGVRPSLLDAYWLAGRSLQAELNQARELLTRMCHPFGHLMIDKAWYEERREWLERNGKDRVGKVDV